MRDSDFLSIRVPGGDAIQEVSALAPSGLGLAPGRSVEVVVFAERQVTLEAIAAVPLADELPPPAPEPWRSADAPGSAEPGGGE